MAGFVCVIEVELRFPLARSLKDKRREVKSLKSRLQQRFGVAVAETADHDAQTLGTVALTLVGNGGVDDRADEICRWIEARHPEGASVRRRTYSLAELLS